MKPLHYEYEIFDNLIMGELSPFSNKEINPELDLGIELSKSGLFNCYGSRVYKYSLSKNGNKI